ncbi:winged helix-turn-helix transcriptional regulator [Clostridium pasteurianum]|uniref:winged helix-turn-helix transcriptional regulator n=1 Tax=Clostridium pasteurianum TaxID=1501 RepID=UPI003119196E
MINSLNIISGKWKLPILCKLSPGNIRYNELKRQYGASTTSCLHALYRSCIPWTGCANTAF